MSNEEEKESLLSPGFRSVVAMAGWDEETLLLASLIVEDTPDRNLTKHRSINNKRFHTPPVTSRRKRRSQRKSPAAIAIPVLNLDEAEQKLREENEQKISPASVPIPIIDLDEEAQTLPKENEQKINEEKKANEVQEIIKPEIGSSSLCSSSSLPCIDRLREELSCAICLEICFEPSTTPCGHSFCKRCLRSAADKCGKKCPKCRQLISNGRSCTINTVLWNTIQLLFPQEVETRKELVKSKNAREMADKTPARRSYYNARNRTIEALNSPENDNRGIRVPRISRRANVRPVAGQDEDAALALRLQREEFMEVFRAGENEPPREQQSRRNNSLNSARANLRAIASRAINIQTRSRPM